MKACSGRCAGVVALWSFCLACGAAGPLERVANTSLQMPLAPPAYGFTFTNALPGLVFTNPVCIASPPGETNRLFILEKRGRIVVITNLAAPTRAIFLDLTARVAASDMVSDERGLLGLAFHPGHATNRQFFVFYTGNTNTTAGNGLHDILARYEASPVNPNLALAGTYTPLLVQFDQANNHNGGDLHFGPDGYLYVAVGDEGGGNDQWMNSQRIDKDYFSAILRLDVDKRPGSLPPNAHPAATTNYAVPPDNPFVGATTFNGLPVNSGNMRTEFWAVGLRNPWRMSFDPPTGLLYAGDVGQSAREEINLISGGGNYGWNYWEGFLQRTNSAQIPAGFVHVPPLIDYPRSLGIAVTGGRVYRGQRFSQLHGAYVYADYGFGNIWALRHSGTNVTQNQLLFSDPGGGVSAFGVDPANGDLLYCDVQNGANGVIKRIVYTATPIGAPLPPTLADTGAFADSASLTPPAGIVAYDLNLPFWSDGAHKRRWFSVPATNQFIGFQPEGNWSFPTGTVWIKHFELELTNGVPASAHRLETRVLVWNTNSGYGVTYRWGSSATNATLVPEEGWDETFVIHDAGGAVVRTQVWHYPGRAECLQCHNTVAGFALGFNTAQLHRDYDYDGTTTNQLLALSLAGYFNTNLTTIRTLRALAHPTNAAVSREYRVRSWLAANCVACHQPGGAQMSLWDARLHTPGPLTGLIDGALVDNLGDPSNRVIAPGDPLRSVLLTRIATTGEGRMPPLASSIVETAAVDLIAAWITNDLPAHQTFAAWQIAHFGSTNAPNSGLTADADLDGASNYLEYLTATDPQSSNSVWRIGIELAGGTPQIVFPQVANRAFEVQATPVPAPAPVWQPLDVPGNEPLFAATNRTAVVPDVSTGVPARYYRVWVYEP